MELLQVNVVFHVSMLKKCQTNQNSILDWTEFPLQEDASYEEPVIIVDFQVINLKRRTIPLVKVQRRHCNAKDAT